MVQFDIEPRQMRRLFREWYQLDGDDLRRVWSEGIIVLDSNVLLGLYLYPKGSLDEFLNVLERAKDRLWIPYQVGLEYHRNREGRIPEQRAILERLLREIEQVSDSLDRLGWPDYHPTLDVQVAADKRRAVQEALHQLSEQVRSAFDATPGVPTDGDQPDAILERLTLLFEGKVGQPLTSDEISKLMVEGAQRYASEVPPGYKDRDKDEAHRYNDLILWKQILKEARGTDEQRSRSTILVTNDRKEDWWRRRQGSVVGPRTELIREYLREVGADFVMYTPERFLEQAREYLDLDVSAETIADAQRISRSSRPDVILMTQRMVLPDHRTRVAALTRLRDTLGSGAVRTVADVSATISRLGGMFTDQNVAVPLFFSLISESYGPIRVEADITRRLRDRAISEVQDLEPGERFVERSHAAWLAQALYRLRYETFSDEELLVAFFGEDYPAEAPTLLRRASEFVQADLALHGVGAG